MVICDSFLAKVNARKSVVIERNGLIVHKYPKGKNVNETHYDIMELKVIC